MNFIIIETVRRSVSVDADSGENARTARERGEGSILNEQVVGRLVQPNHPLPSIGRQARNITGAVGKALLNPKPVQKEERERRLAICNTCEFLVDGKRCQKCGCHVNWKSRLEAWHCPIDKW